MLTKITINNLATIQYTEIDFFPGTTVITGETGSGKSIIIDALLFALGWKLAQNLLPTHADHLTVQLNFTLTPENKQSIDSLGYAHYLTTSEQIIHRSITREGKTKSVFNNQVISLSGLRAVSSCLINVHGQNAQQELLKADKQRELLDNFGNHMELCKKISAISKDYNTVRDQINLHQQLQAQNTVLQQLMSAQVAELNAANLSASEWAELAAAHKKLSNAEHVCKQLSQTLDKLQHEENCNVISILYKTMKALHALSAISPPSQKWADAIEVIVLELDNITKEVEIYLSTLENHTEQLLKVEQRITLLHDLARKYQIAPENLANFHKELVTKLEHCNTNQEELAQLHKQQQELQDHYNSLATELSTKRTIAAQKLIQEITPIIRKLNLPNAELHIQLEQRAEYATPNVNGLDKITFFIRTNLGGNLAPLAKIASGGELSRISLAFYLVNVANNTVPTIIFDEVDVGIGGETAALIGKLMQQLGSHQQVICITHLPQVAVYGTQHIHVAKITSSNNTITQISELSPASRITEIARMLGGVEITPTTLQHAQEMLTQAKESN